MPDIVYRLTVLRDYHYLLYLYQRLYSVTYQNSLLAEQHVQYDFSGMPRIFCRFLIYTLSRRVFFILFFRHILISSFGNLFYQNDSLIYMRE